VFSFQSNKQARVDTAHQGRCVAHIFVMNVGEELAEWPEHPQRQRRWVSPGGGGAGGLVGSRGQVGMRGPVRLLRRSGGLVSKA
jgi:hypothetical protein